MLLDSTYVIIFSSSTSTSFSKILLDTELVVCSENMRLFFPARSKTYIILRQSITTVRPRAVDNDSEAVDNDSEAVDNDSESEPLEAVDNDSEAEG